MKSRSQHRTRIDIIFSILKFIYREGEAKKTHILYATNLNTRSLEKFLDQLVEIKAVKIVGINRSRRYVLTAQGRQLLSLINRLYKIFEVGNNSDYIELIEKLSIFKDPVTTTREDIIVTNKIITGYSGFRYSVSLYGTSRKNYIVSVIDNGMSIEEVIDSIGRLLFYLIDSNENCIIINNAAYYYPAIYFKKIFSRAGINPRRYLIYTTK